ncbi:MAG TPA: hypothetical protein VET48_03090, partial [Steroidobacteraceae bacterium]|nr:hypothetical protein [Steroidobacteraceae bacterium]
MTSANHVLPTAVRNRFIAWTVVVVVMLALFVFRVLPSVKFETDILALLPNTQRDAAMDAALDAFSARIARTQIFLIGAARTEDAKAAADVFAAQLRESSQFAQVNLEINADLQKRAQIFLDHRGFLLARTDSDALQSGKTNALEQQALRAAFTPAGLVRPLGLAEDPLGFLNRFLQAQSISFGNAQLDGSVATVERNGQTYVLLTAETKGSPFAQSVQEQVLPIIQQAEKAARATIKSDLRILTSGALQHAAAATDRATTEISVFGTIETLGVIVLLWSILGALRPLLLASITLGIATAAALTATHYVFGPVHILALVFGSSLIGGVIDYSIHFFADRFRNPEHWTPI